MHLIVAGSRTVEDTALIDSVLDNVRKNANLESVTTGVGGNTDLAAKEWAYQHHIRTNDFPADWSYFRDKGNSKPAGPVRNRKMVLDTISQYGKENVVVIAFIDKPLDESRGTKNLVETANKQGLPIFIYKIDKTSKTVTIQSTLNYEPTLV